MEGDGKSTGSAAAPARRPLRMWLWFAGGFLVVFVGMLLLLHVVPPAERAVKYPLWKYYARDFPMLFASVLGPEDSSTLWKTVFFHLLYSAGGGGASAAVGRCVGRLRNRKAA
jgi:hypothetical protein